MEAIEERYQKIKQLESRLNNYYDIWTPGSRKHVYISEIHEIVTKNEFSDQPIKSSKRSKSPKNVYQALTERQAVKPKRRQAHLVDFKKFGKNSSTYQGKYSRTLISKTKLPQSKSVSNLSPSENTWKTTAKEITEINKLATILPSIEEKLRNSSNKTLPRKASPEKSYSVQSLPKTDASSPQSFTKSATPKNSLQNSLINFIPHASFLTIRIRPEKQEYPYSNYIAVITDISNPPYQRRILQKLKTNSEGHLQFMNKSIIDPLSLFEYQTLANLTFKVQVYGNYKTFIPIIDKYLHFGPQTDDTIEEINLLIKKYLKSFNQPTFTSEIQVNTSISSTSLNSIQPRPIAKHNFQFKSSRPRRPIKLKPFHASSSLSNSIGGGFMNLSPKHSFVPPSSSFKEGFEIKKLQ